MPKSKKFYLKRRDNTQLIEPYYVKCGQITKKEAKKIEKAIYGENTMIAFDTEEQYNEEIKGLIKLGLHIYEN